MDPNLLKSVTDTVNSAVGSAVSQVEQVVPTVVAEGTGLATQVGSAAINAAGNSVPPAGAVANVITGDLTKVIESSVEGAVKAAQSQVAGRIQAALAEALSGLGQPQVATIPSGDLKKVDAWERAGRTFLAGLGITILAGLVQVIGLASSSGVDFFTKQGWYAVGTLAIGSIATSVATYFLRYLKEPAGAAVNSSTKG